MKVKELPKDTNLTKIKVKLPDDVLKAYKEYAGGEPEMWIVGSMMGDWFLSPIAPGIKGKRRLYPMPISVEPFHILDLDVAETKVLYRSAVEDGSNKVIVRDFVWKDDEITHSERKLDKSKVM